jgi:hypothetical protein
MDVLTFAHVVLGLEPYPAQAKTLLSFAAGDNTALQACNNSGKTSVVLPAAILWFLYTNPKGRAYAITASHSQLVSQTFYNLREFADRPAFRGWKFLETDIRTPKGGWVLGRAPGEGGSAAAGTVEGAHSKEDSPFAVFIDEAKSVKESIYKQLARCYPKFRLYASSTGEAAGSFYRICSEQSEPGQWSIYKIRSTDCPHIPRSLVQSEMISLEQTVYLVKHACEWIFGFGDSVIDLRHVRDLVQNPPAFIPGSTSAFCDPAGGGDMTVMAACVGNELRVVFADRERDTMASVGRILHHFRGMKLENYQFGMMQAALANQ